MRWTTIFRDPWWFCKFYKQAGDKCCCQGEDCKDNGTSRIGFLSALDLAQKADPRGHCFSQTLTPLQLCKKENTRIKRTKKWAIKYLSFLLVRFGTGTRSHSKGPVFHTHLFNFSKKKIREVQNTKICRNLRSCKRNQIHSAAEEKAYVKGHCFKFPSSSTTTNRIYFGWIKKIPTLLKTDPTKETNTTPAEPEAVIRILLE